MDIMRYLLTINLIIDILSELYFKSCDRDPVLLEDFRESVEMGTGIQGKAVSLLSFAPEHSQYQRV
jgi:hypothetical protein